MNLFFVDTFYWIALSNPRDQWHRRVLAFHTTVGTYRLYTTDEVLMEFLTFYSEGAPHVRRRAALFARNILANPFIIVLPQTHTSFLEGLSFYEARLDKEYSITDCISMLVMRRERLADVLTNDHHFTQEGFHIVFP
jgi:predicted nucleic acid-binding protein